MINVYQYKIYPTPTQTLELRYWLRVGQYWYNRQLGERFDWWDMNRCNINSCPLVTSIALLKEKPSRYGQSGQLPSLKKDYQFVKNTSELLDFSRVPANTFQAVCKQVEDSFNRFLKGDCNGKKSGSPRFVRCSKLCVNSLKLKKRVESRLSQWSLSHCPHVKNSHGVWSH